MGSQNMFSSIWYRWGTSTAVIPAQAVQRDGLGREQQLSESTANCTGGITADRAHAFAENSSVKGQ